MSALIWCPFPDRASAREVAARLLDLSLVACANLIGPVESLFVWQGARNEAQEIGVLFKTDAALLHEAIAAIAAHHPYDCPAVLGWRVDAANTGAAEWLGALAGSREG